MVPENIHTPPTEGIGNSGEEGGLKDPKIWNFWRGGGVIGQIPSVGGGGGMDIFWNYTFYLYHINSSVSFSALKWLGAKTAILIYQYLLTKAMLLLQ